MAVKNSHCSFCGARFPEDLPFPRKCASCQKITFLNPAPVAVLLQPVDDGLLVIRRGIGPGRGCLALPGGFIDWGETWQEGAARELREETGLSIAPASVRERCVLSAPPGFVLIFGIAPPMTRADLTPFEPNEEVTERLVIAAPEAMAFPFHTQVIEEYFAEQAGK